METTVSRRSALKTFTGTILAGLVGTGSSIAKTFIGETPLNAATLPTLFNVQGMTGPQGLIFNLVFRDPSDPQYFRVYETGTDKPLSIYNDKDGIPTVVVQFEKQTVDCSKMTNGNITNCVKQFIDYVLNEKLAKIDRKNGHFFVDEQCIPVCKWNKKYGSGGQITDFYSNLVIESNKIAVRCRIGAGNRLLLHPLHKNLVESIPPAVKSRWEFIYNEDMPKDKMILWYNGLEFYDGAITVAFAIDEKEVDKAKLIKQKMCPHQNTNKYMLCFHDNCLHKYCTIIEI